MGGVVQVEPRRGGTPGDQKIVMVFPAPVTFTGASVTGAGTVRSTTPAANSAPTGVVTVNLTRVANAQQMTVNLNGVSTGAAPTTISVPMRVLLGDTNVDGSVNSGDLQQPVIVPANSSTGITSSMT